MKMFIIILSLITPLFAQELKQPASQEAINRAWIKAANHSGLTQILYREYNKEKNEGNKKALDTALKKLDGSFKKLVKIKQLRHFKAKISFDKLSNEKKQSYQTLVSNLTSKYGHVLALEMMDMGTSHLLKHGFKMPDNITLNTHLPKLESKQLESLIAAKGEQVKIELIEFKLTKKSPQHLLWLNATSSIQNYVDTIQMLAKRGGTDPAEIMPFVDSYEKAIQLLVDVKILEKKTYQQSYKSLPKQIKSELAVYQQKLVPEYGVHLPREMLGDSLVQMIKALDPNYNTNQFSVYLPKPHFNIVTKMIDTAVAKDK